MNLDAIKSAIKHLVVSPEPDLDEALQRLGSIIQKLSEKKVRLKEQLQELGEHDQTSERYVEFDQEYQVVSKLLKKAKQSYSDLSHQIPADDEGET